MNFMKENSFLKSNFVYNLIAIRTAIRTANESQGTTRNKKTKNVSFKLPSKQF